jgi:hypothetical protein
MEIATVVGGARNLEIQLRTLSKLFKFYLELFNDVWIASGCHWVDDGLIEMKRARELPWVLDELNWNFIISMKLLIESMDASRDNRERSFETSRNPQVEHKS